MTLHHSPRFNRALILFATTLPYACVGTEADNPFTERNPAQTTPCKSHDEYEPFALSGLLDAEPSRAKPGLHLASTPAPKDPAADFSQAGDGLTPLSEFPIVPECVDWAVVGNELALQYVGFISGCGITWTGGARVAEPGVIALELSAVECRVAACENCNYDARARIPLEAIEGQQKVTLRLSLDTCGDSPSVSEWVIDRAELAAGNRCKADGSDSWGGAQYATAYQLDLYENCDPDAMTLDRLRVDGICAEALTCSAGRCLPSCTTDEECPLNGAFVCVEGLCQLRK